jgi:hypothetical protein
VESTAPTKPKPDRSAYTYFAVGGFLGLLQWGLGLIGITFNLWLGAAVLLLAFGLMTHAVWIGVPWITKGTILRRSVRIVTCVVAVGGYGLLIGPRLASDFSRIKPPSKSEAKAEPPKTPIQPSPVPPVAPPSLPAPHTPLVRLVFKDSPGFTAARKEALSENSTKCPIGVGFRISGLRLRSAFLATATAGRRTARRGVEAEGLQAEAVLSEV